MTPPSERDENGQVLSVILAAHDHSDPTIPFVHALALALAAQGELEVVDVRRERRENGSLGIRERLEQWKVLPPGSERDDVASVGLKVKKIRKKGDPRKGVGERLMRHDHDLLVIGTRPDRGAIPLFSQDFPGHLAQSARQTTLYVPEGAKPFVDPESGVAALRRILVPAASEPSISPALAMLQRILVALRQEPLDVIGLHAGDSFPPLGDAPVAEMPWREVLVPAGGEPLSRTISQAARGENADLVVMSTNGRDTLAQKIVGSITEQVLREIECPLLAVVAR